MEFYFKLLLSFIIGSVWITLATVIAEQFGSKVGGVIAGVPSTILVSLFFIGWTQNLMIAKQATSIIPAILALDALFVFIYILMGKFGFLSAATSSLIFWIILALTLIFNNFNRFFLGFLFLLIVLIFVFNFSEKKMHIIPQKRKRIQYTLGQILIRGLITGTIIVFSVVMAKIGGPLFGGAFSCFPAVMISTMVITYYEHGMDFSRAVMKILMISGPINVVIYAIFFRFSILSFGLFGATLFAFIISIISTYMVYRFVNKKML